VLGVTVGIRDAGREDGVSFAFRVVSLLGVVVEVDGATCLGLRCNVFGVRFGCLEGVV
jgi:hypothetical protein